MNAAANINPMSIPARLNNVSIEFNLEGGRKLRALDNVTLELKPGEFLVLVGASGSGKTTALNMFASLLRPTSGDATVFGKAPVNARRHLGYMFARDALMPWRTARQNIEFAMQMRGVGRAERRSTATRLLSIMKLDQYGENYPSQLSQGQRQRVALARTWALSPDIILMDEPFSALDAQTREELQAEFLKICAGEKKSVIFVTHDLSEALTLADRIVVFSRGRIAEEFVIDLPKPRDMLTITESPAAREIYKKLRSLLAH